MEDILLQNIEKLVSLSTEEELIVLNHFESASTLRAYAYAHKELFIIL